MIAAMDQGGGTCMRSSSIPFWCTRVGHSSARRAAEREIVAQLLHAATMNVARALKRAKKTEPSRVLGYRASVSAPEYLAGSAKRITLKKSSG